MKKSLLAFALIIGIFGCSKEIKHESKTCTFNGQPVDCERLNGNGNGNGNTDQGEPLQVEARVLFEFIEISGREYFNVLNKVSMRAGNSAGTVCELLIPQDKYEVELYEKNRLVLKDQNGEQVFKYKLGSSRSAQSKYNGIWVQEERVDNMKTILALNFNNNLLMAKLDCIPQ